MEQCQACGKEFEVVSEMGFCEACDAEHFGEEQQEPTTPASYLPNEGFVAPEEATSTEKEKHDLLSVMMGAILKKTDGDTAPEALNKMLTFNNVFYGMNKLNRNYTREDVSRIIDSMITKNGYVRYYATPTITFYGLTKRFWAEVQANREARQSRTGASA